MTDGPTEHAAQSTSEQAPQPIVEEFSNTCWCPQPDTGENLLDANNNCRSCGTHWS